MTTPPHLANLALTYVTEDRVDEYFATVIRGFHHDYNPEVWRPHQVVFEPERNFGFAVDGRWVSTCGAYTQRMTVPGGTVPVAAVTLVTVNPSYRRRGLLRQMMTHQLEGIAAQGTEPVALLWASEATIYGRFGYGETLSRLRLSGQTRALTFGPWVELEGSVGEVEREEFLPVAQRLRESWLPDRPGALDRNDAWWEIRLHDPEAWRKGASAYRFVLHFAHDGQPDGYAHFRVKEEGPDGYAEVVVESLDAATSTAYAGLWRFVLSLDLVSTFSWHDAPTDEPLRVLVTDPRAIKAELADGTYARLVDVPAALAARRYAAEIDVVVGVADPLLAQNDRAFRLQGGPDGAVVKPSRRRPDLSLNVRELGAIYLGGVSPVILRRAGLVTEHTRGTVARVAAAFSWGSGALLHRLLLRLKVIDFGGIQREEQHGLDHGDGRMRIYESLEPATARKDPRRPAVDWPDRFAEFDELLGQAWEIRRPAATRLEVDLPAAAGLAGRLADLFQREAACCAFFTFELTIVSGEALLVAISVPEAKTSVLDALAAGAGPV